MSVTVKEPEAIMQAVKGFTEETVRALSAAPGAGMDACLPAGGLATV
ncbi:MAG: hypothetical protein IPK16_04550 [Anaerolineales bacterium]|nr:hypothetical protein [Anaerolineales bacterium]